MIRTYSELIRIPTFEERFEYAKLEGQVGADTFGWDRYINQVLYRSSEWKKFRNKIIMRDNGCDLAHPDFIIQGRIIIIHHLIPLTIKDVENRSQLIFDEENVICVSHRTHNAIHYGDVSQLTYTPNERKPNDTCPWKQ